MRNSNDGSDHGSEFDAQFKSRFGLWLLLYQVSRWFANEIMVWNMVLDWVHNQNAGSDVKSS